MGRKAKSRKLDLNEVPNMPAEEVNRYLKIVEDVDVFKKIVGAAQTDDVVKIKDQHGRPKWKGVWKDNGNEKLIEFAAKFQNHEWTKDEAKDLLEGKNLTINDFLDSKGNPIPFSGRLDYQYHMGNAYVGFTKIPEKLKAKESAIEIIDERAAEVENLFDFDEQAGSDGAAFGE